MPCTFEIEVPGLGYLDNNPNRALKRGTSVELPLWLAEMLAVSSSQQTKNIVTLDLPSALSARVLNALKADPKSVDVRALAMNFYMLGARILELFEEDEVCDVLMQSWRERAKEVADHAGNMGKGDGSVGTTQSVEFIKGLDDMERALFLAAHEGSVATKRWMGEMKKG